MDPCPFVRVLVVNLALKIPVAVKRACSEVHPSSSPCYCKIRLGGLPCQTAAVPLIPSENAFPPDQSLTLAAGFHLNRANVDKLAAKSLFAGGRPYVTVAIYIGCRGTTCGINSGRLLGWVTVPIDLKDLESLRGHHRPPPCLRDRAPDHGRI